MKIHFFIRVKITSFFLPTIFILLKNGVKISSNNHFTKQCRVMGASLGIYFDDFQQARNFSCLLLWWMLMKLISRGWNGDKFAVSQIFEIFMTILKKGKKGNLSSPVCNNVKITLSSILFLINSRVFLIKLVSWATDSIPSSLNLHSN